MLTVNLDSRVPLVEQIEQGIRAAIASGQLMPGDQLPPVRQLASDLGANFNTIARAYRALEASGLVRSLRGRGTVVKASSELLKGPPEEVRSKLNESIRALLTDARLAGLEPDEVKKLFANEFKSFWPKK